MASQLCGMCKQPVDENDPTIYHEIKVWVHGPKKDGATARQETGRIAHAECVSLVKQGQAPDQDRLF